MDQEIQNMIDSSIKKAMAFSTPKYGDTPTDALQLVPKKYADAITGGYAGYVNSDGSAGNLPSGWTSSKISTGLYQIVHNLGTANYSGIAIANATAAFCKQNATNTNDVSFVFLDAAGSVTDSKFYFTLTPF